MNMQVKMYSLDFCTCTSTQVCTLQQKYILIQISFQLNPIPTRLSHVIYCCGYKSYSCLVGIGLKQLHGRLQKMLVTVKFITGITKPHGTTVYTFFCLCSAPSIWVFLYVSLPQIKFGYTLSFIIYKQPQSIPQTKQLTAD